MIKDHVVGTKTGKKTKGGPKDERATPLASFAKWNEEFQFTVDAASSKQNAKCAKFWTKEDNGLAQSWASERVWINPPYSDIAPWIEKAATFEADLVVMLLPVWTDRKWFQSVWKGELSRGHLIENKGTLTLEFLPGRLRFCKPESLEPEKDSSPFPCMLMIFTKNGFRK